jgi:long-chain acyl-CoA synthetase
MSKISEVFFQNAINTPYKIAVWCEDIPVTYASLANRVSYLSDTLLKKGIRRGDHIGILLPNSIEFVVVILVASTLGVVLVPLNISLSVSAIYHSFKSADVKHIIATSNILESLVKQNQFNCAFASGVWFPIDNEDTAFNNLQNLSNHLSYDSLPQNLSQDIDPFILTMTSGSTGEPKPIVLTQQTKWNRAFAAVKLYGITANDITLAATPLYHSLAERLALIPMLTNGTLVLMTRFSPSEWLRIVSKYSVTFTIAVSSQLSQISKQLAKETGQKITSLRCVVSSSAKLSTQVKTELLSHLRCDFHECYGASEIAIASNLDTKTYPDKLDSVGQAAPGVDIKILQENDWIAAPGEIGEIACKTSMLFGGYFKKPELTQKAMWGEYFKTGDIGCLDKEGFLYFLGRKKEIIISGGINIHPSDIEAVVSAHPSVQECAAFAMADERLGEAVAVVIIPNNFNNFEVRKIRFHCAEHLADYQQPQKILVVDELPKNGMGKIMRQELISQFGEFKA